MDKPIKSLVELSENGALGPCDCERAEDACDCK
jgi:hypothetical protein